MQEKILNIIEDVTDEKVESIEMNLFDTGILDSFKVIDMVSELEEEFDIEINAQYVVEENFCTISAMEVLVKKIIGA